MDWTEIANGALQWDGKFCWQLTPRISDISGQTIWVMRCMDNGEWVYHGGYTLEAGKQWAAKMDADPYPRWRKRWVD